MIAVVSTLKAAPAPTDMHLAPHLMARLARLARPGRQAAATLPLLLAASLAQAQTPPADTVGATVTTSSGLVYKLMQAGKGNNPQATDTVRVHYRGTLADGKEFDSSYSRGSPAEFPLNRVIKCWTEGVQRMQPGAKAKLTCPPAIAYGERGAGGVIPPNATLTFEVELLGIVK